MCFVMKKVCLSWQNYVCHDKIFLSQQKQAYFCRNKRHVLSQQTRVCHGKSNTCGSSRQWYSTAVVVILTYYIYIYTLAIHISLTLPSRTHLYAQTDLQQFNELCDYGGSCVQYSDSTCACDLDLRTKLLFLLMLIFLFVCCCCMWCVHVVHFHPCRACELV